MSNDHPLDSPEGRDWVKRHNEELLPMIKDSTYSIGVISGGEPDAKQAVEIGFMLLLGKPLILAVTPGAQVPYGLARAADAIVEFDDSNMESTQRRLMEAIETLEGRQG
jgi:hypothetical protein